MAKQCKCPSGATRVSNGKGKKGFGCMAHTKAKGCHRFVRVKKVCPR